MPSIHEINAFLKETLDPSGMSDAAMNGIQVETDADITKAAFAVDASLEAVVRAAAEGCGLIVAHHGFFWGHPLPVAGNMRKRLALMLEKEIGLIAYHLPLDAHPEYGNNSRILRALSLLEMEPFGKYKGSCIGFMARSAEPLSIEMVMERLGITQTEPPQAVLPFGPREIRTIAAVSGGGAQSVDEAIEKKVDLFITGDASHQVYHAAREAGLSVLSAGHYFTETFGVRALMEPLGERFGMETVFLDIPTGL